MKKLTAILSAMLMVLNTAVFTVNADDKFIDFDTEADKSLFELWDDENESSLEFPATGGVDGGAFHYLFQGRQASYAAQNCARVRGERRRWELD